MSDSHWRGPVAFVVLGTVVAAIVLWITWDLASLETRKRVEAEQAANQYAKGVEGRIADACAGRAPVAYAKCVYEEAKATHENQRAQYDLAAQEGMFRWARWMTAVSALGTLVAGAGVYFVWRSLEHTREAISNDREIGHAQARAYITIERPFVITRVEPDTIYWHLHVTIRNSGQTPARQVVIDASFEESEYMSIDTLPDIAALSKKKGKAVLHTGEESITFIDTNQTQVNFTATVRVRFQDVFMGDSERTVEEVIVSGIVVPLEGARTKLAITRRYTSADLI